MPPDLPVLLSGFIDDGITSVTQFREGPDHGVLIKDITLREIWPGDKFPNVEIVTDETPQWFAGGTFEFSPNCRVLVHKTRLGNTVRINLQDGSVSGTGKTN